MRGTVGALVGFIILAVGLAGVGVALAPLMTHTNQHADLISLGGLGAFVASLVVMLLLIRY